MGALDGSIKTIKWLYAVSYYDSKKNATAIQWHFLNILF
jgi:hypothetical protein